MENVKLKVVLEPAEEGGYTVYVPSLPGCISQGDTKQEALKNVKEAIELYLEPGDLRGLLKGLDVDIRECEAILSEARRSLARTIQQNPHTEGSRTP